MTRRLLPAAAAALALVPTSGWSQATASVPAPLPAAVVDLRTDEGARLVQAQWRYRDVGIVTVTRHEPGPDLRATGAPNTTHDIAPQAQGADFDDSAWETSRRPPSNSAGPTAASPSTGTAPG